MSNGFSRHRPRWPTSSWFNGLSEVDTQDWSAFTTKILHQFDSVTAQNKAGAVPRNAKIRNT